jgi:hypothetical protein
MASECKFREGDKVKPGKEWGKNRHIKNWVKIYRPDFESGYVSHNTIFSSDGVTGQPAVVVEWPTGETYWYLPEELAHEQETVPTCSLRVLDPELIETPHIYLNQNT